MAKEVFRTQLESLERISQKLDVIKKRVENFNQPMQKFRGSILSVNAVAKTLEKTFSRIFGILKNIGLTTLFGGGIIGFRGLQAQKQVTEAGRLGITTQERGALEYAGKQSQADSDFFKDILKNIRTALVNFPQSVEHFARLGLTREDVQGKSPFEMIQKVLSQAQKSTIDPFLINESLQSLAGIDFNTLKSLDLSKIEAFYKEGLTYTSNSAKEISRIGEGVNRVTTNLTSLLDRLLASFSPAIESIFNNIAKSLNSISKNKAFQELLDKLTQWAVKFSESFDTRVLDFINNIPSVIERMQETFFRILQGLSEFAGFITFGQTSKRAYSFAEYAKERADELEKSREQRESLQKNIVGGTINNSFNPSLSANINLNVNNDEGMQSRSFKQNMQFSGNLRGGGY